ncbi:o-succinylbenzoate synthase [Anabaena cylindrica FACHB-243]|uniref:o-succinylbenzoate synthase n=1 Tax=Anabaena cylindrica (strain ATCC 27899 / PCC 7122) TaxID=272123 RepID=K9ZMM0_ANACC|nr:MULTISPECIES: o-succinylbenzoate synthase [Anabaena]AFZ59777.1 o-succinylbenzoic acid (OSB) synthetase [Anabaena cylindrica PCC 7122]MBD2417180.1 o-succinylbenzoate synthase [Anabaena cylindrica FACHB-243]MBY5282264.1 o-succinylbenzoate synthase [Anabaena sp. CCAP 1446/1C]MBY5309405.1 o-succinylbenzoate synthase [Anabaena sp. CCAP 1446/1C]MCM2405004.1 o-succinylbenzoate synthase [Anabaena sp. CCAP 1446/1C]
MNYQFSFRPIRQKFTRPIVTSHGIWEIRESMIIRLIDVKGTVSWGEISPISWFGSETIKQALDFCSQLPTEITREIIFSIPNNLPACQFGFESALEKLEKNNELTSIDNLTYSGLLPAGKAALDQWQGLWKQGYKTFKWKIGVDKIATELNVFNSLIQNLPNSLKLRLDANGGLSYEEAKLWLKTCENLQTKIEFIEQPLPINQFREMLELSNLYSTQIALDESVATLQQLEDCYKQSWRSIYVIKPGIIGSPSQLRKFCQEYEIDLVFSSVLETEIGRQAALQLAAELSKNNRAVGFGINHFFTQQPENWLQSLWNNL